MTIDGDTDSIFVQFPGLSATDCVVRSREAADMVTRQLSRPPIKLEYEKCYSKFIIQQIKRYAGAIFDEDIQQQSSTTKCEIKGFECQQRDTPLYIVSAIRSVLEVITTCDNSSAARDAAIDAMLKVKRHEHTALDLCFSKALRLWESSQKVTTSREQTISTSFPDVSSKSRMYDSTQAHVEVASTIETQSNGQIQFESGQRVQYVFCTPAATQSTQAWARKQCPLYKRATDPHDVLLGKRQIDWPEALRQLQMPLARIFELPGVTDNDDSWQFILNDTESREMELHRARPWRKIYSTSTKDADSTKGTIRAFFHQNSQRKCIACNTIITHKAIHDICGSDLCRSKLQQIKLDLQSMHANLDCCVEADRLDCVKCAGSPNISNYQQDHKRSSAYSLSHTMPHKATASQTAAGLAGCENTFCAAPYRLAFSQNLLSKTTEQIFRCPASELSCTNKNAW